MIDKQASNDYLAMRPYWDLAETITAGKEAVQADGKRFLNRFPAESNEAYKYRTDNLVLVDIFSEILEGLASKPFTREASIDSDSPFWLELQENADRTGKHINSFAYEVFYNGIKNAVDWLLIDHETANETATLADERNAGARPYIVRVPAVAMLEVRSEIEQGREVLTFVKIDESQGDFDRLRVFEKVGEQVIFTVYEAEKGKDLQVAQQGIISLGYIPIIPFNTGFRIGASWQFDTPLKRIADLQIEHIQAGTNLKIAKEQVAFPILVGEGVSPPIDNDGNITPLKTGPASVLFSPQDHTGAHGSWKIIEPTTTSLQFLADERDKIEAQMRELGRLPMTTGTSGVTQVAMGMANQRANSAVQAWAFLLKDALENALAMCADWANLEDSPQVLINTNFPPALDGGTDAEIIKRLYDDAIISAETLINEYKRRGILSEDVDNDLESLLLLKQNDLINHES